MSVKNEDCVLINLKILMNASNSVGNFNILVLKTWVHVTFKIVFDTCNQLCGYLWDICKDEMAQALW